MRTVIALTLVATLSGCGTISEFFKDKRRNEYKVYPDDSLLVDCLIPQPPNPVLYMQSNLTEREKALTGYSGALMDSLVACNVQKAKMRELKMKGQ